MSSVEMLIWVVPLSSKHRGKSAIQFVRNMFDYRTYNDSSHYRCGAWLESHDCSDLYSTSDFLQERRMAEPCP